MTVDCFPGILFYMEFSNKVFHFHVQPSADAVAKNAGTVAKGSSAGSIGLDSCNPLPWIWPMWAQPH